MLSEAEAARLREFIRGACALAAPPLTPELRIWQASEITPIWAMTEAALEREGLAPPFWAFAWAGGQGLARWLMDHPGEVAGRRVLCLACGAGLEALAAARAGAASATVNDIDPAALVAAAMNAEANGLALDFAAGDLTAGDPAGGDPAGFDVVLAADVFYEKGPAARIGAWLRACAAGGATVIAADAGRGMAPGGGERLAAFDVPTLRALEDRDSRTVTLWRVGPG